MENQIIKRDQQQNRADTWKHNWEVIKPFVHFGIKAMAIVGGAMISIIKLLPMLVEPKKDNSKGENSVIKI